MNILQQADQITSQDRQEAYGHPRAHFERTVSMLNAAFAHKLRDPLEPRDWATIMMIDKIARLIPAQKRDTLVDIAGYARTAEMVAERLTIGPDVNPATLSGSIPRGR